MLDLRIHATCTSDVRAWSTNRAVGVDDRGRWWRKVFGVRRAVADGGAVPGVPAHAVVGVFIADDRYGRWGGGR